MWSLRGISSTSCLAKNRTVILTDTEPVLRIVDGVPLFTSSSYYMLGKAWTQRPGMFAVCPRGEEDGLREQCIRAVRWSDIRKDENLLRALLWRSGSLLRN